MNCCSVEYQKLKTINLAVKTAVFSKLGMTWVYIKKLCLSAEPIVFYMAERVGFEPTEPLQTAHTISSRALSTGLSHLSILK